MLNEILKVQEFHTAFGAPVGNGPAILEEKRLQLRYKLIMEEANEFGVAAGLIASDGSDLAYSPNMVEMADALMDLLYVTFGTIVELGLQYRAEKMFAHVHDSNMSKLGEDGKPIYREDGKVLKGPNFFKPELENFLKA